MGATSGSDGWGLASVVHGAGATVAGAVHVGVLTEADPHTAVEAGNNPGGRLPHQPASIFFLAKPKVFRTPRQIPWFSHRHGKGVLAL